MKVTLHCSKCGHLWTSGYWKWILTAPFHWVYKWKDWRFTKCPNCGVKSWIARRK